MSGYNTETIVFLEVSVVSYDGDFHRLIRHCEEDVFLVKGKCVAFPFIACL